MPQVPKKSKVPEVSHICAPCHVPLVSRCPRHQKCPRCVDTVCKYLLYNTHVAAADVAVWLQFPTVGVIGSKIPNDDHWNKFGECWKLSTGLNLLIRKIMQHIYKHSLVIIIRSFATPDEGVIPKMHFMGAHASFDDQVSWSCYFLPWKFKFIFCLVNTYAQSRNSYDPPDWHWTMQYKAKHLYTL